MLVRVWSWPFAFGVGRVRWFRCFIIAWGFVVVLVFGGGGEVGGEKSAAAKKAAAKKAVAKKAAAGKVPSSL